MTARLMIGDVRTRIREIPDGSVDLICTSPPFLALRKYGDDPESEMGSEATPAEFIDGLLALTAEFRRVLAPHGSIAVELGDTFSGSGGAGGDWIEGSGQRVYKRGNVVPDPNDMPQRKGAGWPKPKSLCLTPYAYPMALAYGHNPITGQPSPAGQWMVRNMIAWARPNPPVGDLADKVRPGIVLDPFAGSGTTLAVATGCGRDAIGIELYEENAHLIRERVGMFLEEVA
jgi:DNA modification methylase